MRHFDERIGVTMRILGMLLGTVLLAGCSTSTPSLDETDQVPKERLYNYQFRDDGDAFLVVSRDREFLGSVCNTRLIIDSRLAAEIQAGPARARVSVFRRGCGWYPCRAMGSAAARRPSRWCMCRTGRPRITGSPWTPA